MRYNFYRGVNIYVSLYVFFKFGKFWFERVV